MFCGCYYNDSRMICDKNKERIGIVNVNKLRGKIVERGMNVEELASKIGIDRASLYRKLNNSEKITIGDATKMKEALALSNAEAYEIFLA